MNTDHLNQITPELVKEFEGCFLTEDDAHVAYLAMKHQDALIAALHAGLRLKRELDQTITTP